MVLQQIAMSPQEARMRALLDSQENGTFTVKMWHPVSFCTGGCSQHPLVEQSETFTIRESDTYPWGDWAYDGVMEALAKETEQARTERLRKEELAEQENLKRAEALKQAQYAEQCKFKSSLGLKRGQKAAKIAQPCKCLYELKGRGYTSTKVSSECWAHQYTDAKGIFKAPHTCQYLHPGEEGWLSEWSNLPCPRVNFRIAPPKNRLDCLRA